jgi:hypothetical protein
MRMFSTCVTGACTVFLGFSGFSWLDTRSPWFCSKGIGICSYLYTEDRGIVVPMCRCLPGMRPLLSALRTSTRRQIPVMMMIY